MEIIVSTTAIDSIMDRELIKESTIFDFELYQLIIDAICYCCRTGDSIENYLYGWIYNFKDDESKWRVFIGHASANHLAYIIKRAANILSLDVPGLIDMLIRTDSDYNVSVYNNFIVLRN